jgi:hypothetical protein
MICLKIGQLCAAFFKFLALCTAGGRLAPQFIAWVAFNLENFAFFVVNMVYIMTEATIS